MGHMGMKCLKSVQGNLSSCPEQLQKYAYCLVHCIGSQMSALIWEKITNLDNAFFSTLDILGRGSKRIIVTL